MGTGILCREADTSVPVPMCVIQANNYIFMKLSVFPENSLLTNKNR